MATKTNANTKLILKVSTGHDETGKEMFRQRTFAHINPALSDDAVLTLGTKLAGLQSDTLVSIARTDNATLA